MHTRRAAMAAALPVIALAVAATGPASAAPNAGNVGNAVANAVAKRTVIVDCTHHGHVKPRSILIACADGTNQLAKLTWTHWGAKKATGAGVQRANDCKPSCANGHIHHFRARVTAYKPKRWHHKHRFTQIRLTYRHHGPGHRKHVTYVLNP